MIDTRLLVYFLSVAREQSFTKAAEALNITQPTLSKQMMQLEEQLGQQLFIRGKTITLTEEGQYLRTQAQEIVDLLSATENALKQTNGIVGGDLFIGCGETATMSNIASVCSKIHEQYPAVHFHTYSGDAQSLTERLDKGLIDIALLLGPIREEKYNYINLHHPDHFGILLNKNHPFAQKKELTIEEITELPLAIPHQLANGSEKAAWFGNYLSKMNIVASYNLIYNITFFVEQNLCAALCLDRLVQNPNLTFVPVIPDISVDAFLVTRKYQTQSPALRVFLDTLQTGFISK